MHQKDSAAIGPAACTGARNEQVKGNPDPDRVSTSFVGHQNLAMRMYMRRFTRLTNGFSKKGESHAHAVSLHFMYYNFVRIHKTLKVTSAMAARVSNCLWDISDIARLLEE